MGLGGMVWWTWEIYLVMLQRVVGASNADHCCCWYRIYYRCVSPSISFAPTALAAAAQVHNQSEFVCEMSSTCRRCCHCLFAVATVRCQLIYLYINALYVYIYLHIIENKTKNAGARM